MGIKMEIGPTLLLVEGGVRLAQLLYVHEHNLLVGVLKEIWMTYNYHRIEKHSIFQSYEAFHFLSVRQYRDRLKSLSKVA